MIDTYVYALVLILLGLSTTGFIVARQRYIRVIKTVAQLVIDKGVLTEKIDKLELQNSKEANDGFVKFLSQSRDAAFKYIEDVQVSIQNYVDVIDTGTEEEIKLARMELFSHLPEVPELDDKNKG
jgi:hypothetical protein